MSEAPQLIGALSEQEVAAIEREVAHLPDRPSAAIEALQIVQQARGWVSDESLSAVALWGPCGRVRASRVGDWRRRRDPVQAIARQDRSLDRR